MKMVEITETVMSLASKVDEKELPSARFGFSS